MTGPAAAREAPPFAWPQVRPVPLRAPLYWLARGFDDLLAAPAASLFYGTVLALMGFGLTQWFGGAPGLAMTTGFLLVGPFLAVGLYDISRRLAGGQRVRLVDTVTAWRGNFPAIGFFALILMLSLAVWLRVSVVIVALFVPDGVDSVAGVVRLLQGSPEAIVFALAYLTAGAVLAAFSFATSAVSLPMLLDRRTMDAITAMIVSFQVIRANRRAMALWAAIIVALTAGGFLAWFAGLVFVVPLIGHATWHAYRDCVVPDEPTAAALEISDRTTP